MYEEQAAWGILLKQGLMTWREYDALLDIQYEENAGDELLNRLEWSDNRKDALVILLSLLERQDLDLEALGRRVFARLEELYRAGERPIREFDRLIRETWSVLPDGIQREEAIFPLCYADEALDYTGEGAARRIYEAAFRRYHPDAPPFPAIPADAPPEKTGFWQRIFGRRHGG